MYVKFTHCMTRRESPFFKKKISVKQTTFNGTDAEMNYRGKVSYYISRKIYKEKLTWQAIRNRLNKKVRSNVTFIKYPECKITWSPFATNVNKSKYV